MTISPSHLLHLVATRRTTHGFNQSGQPKIYGCASGMVTMFPRLRFQFGFVQVVANIPHAAGLWPALWLPAANGKNFPESDMWRAGACGSSPDRTFTL